MRLNSKVGSRTSTTCEWIVRARAPPARLYCQPPCPLKYSKSGTFFPNDRQICQINNRWIFLRLLISRLLSLSLFFYIFFFVPSSSAYFLLTFLFFCNAKKNEDIVRWRVVTETGLSTKRAELPDSAIPCRSAIDPTFFNWFAFLLPSFFILFYLAEDGTKVMHNWWV